MRGGQYLLTIVAETHILDNFIVCHDGCKLLPRGRIPYPRSVIT